VSLRKVRNKVVRAAFTLMEMLVVVAIIVMLAGLSTWGYMRYLETTKLGKAKMDISHISGAVDAYKSETGDYPPNLQVLLEARDGLPAALEAKDIVDPWGKPYVYDPNTKNPTTFRPKISSSSAQNLSNW